MAGNTFGKKSVLLWNIIAYFKNPINSLMHWLGGKTVVYLTTLCGLQTIFTVVRYDRLIASTELKMTG
jgi:hypothetical protein